MTNGLVSHGVLTEVVTNHVSSDFDGVPVFTRVDFANGTNHLGHDDGVSEVRLDWSGLLTVRGVLDRLSQLLDETVVTGVDSASESSACSGSEHSDDVSSGDLQELVELDTSVNLLFEWFSFGSLGGLGSSEFFLDGGHIYIVILINE